MVIETHFVTLSVNHKMLIGLQKLCYITEGEGNEGRGKGKMEGAGGYNCHDLSVV